MGHQIYGIRFPDHQLAWKYSQNPRSMEHARKKSRVGRKEVSDLRAKNMSIFSKMAVEIFVLISQKMVLKFMNKSEA